jgi:hypothetical protein
MLIERESTGPAPGTSAKAPALHLVPPPSPE